MIDQKIWNLYAYGGATLEFKEMLDALKENFECPRCGRADLPLALIPHHDRSCRFELGHIIDGSAIDCVERLLARIEELEERLGMNRDFRCDSCSGIFDLEHASSITAKRCKWCASW